MRICNCVIMQEGGNCEGCKYNDGTLQFGHTLKEDHWFEKFLDEKIKEIKEREWKDVE
jgi:Fe-S cluster biogenesis protein NfuA